MKHNSCNRAESTGFVASHHASSHHTDVPSSHNYLKRSRNPHVTYRGGAQESQGIWELHRQKFNEPSPSESKISALDLEYSAKL